MAQKPKTQYVCSECGATSPKWAGQCGECGAWNSLTEQALPVAALRRGGQYAGAEGARRLGEVKLEKTPRQATGLDELDRVLGGGLVPGSVILLGGDPGIGKSTLLLQTLVALQPTLPGLYVTGEESLDQVALRAQRLGLAAFDLQLLAETSVERIIQQAEALLPKVMVVDSIQTLFSENLTAAPGSVSQVREAAALLTRLAKQRGICVFLIGHVTKEGAIAGPRLLEHIVDTVLYFEGEAGSRYRVIRAVKNRFGAANELGVFAMTEHGLKPVSNPSAIFLSRHEEPVPGSVIMVTREGSRPLLVEVQALVAESPFGQPRRVTLGLEQNRLAMLLAVMHRHAGVAMFDQDVFINVVGGVKISETAADLPLLCAALSSLRNRPLPADTVIFGEVGLAGELRPVPHGLERLREAAKHGFKRAIVPKANLQGHPPKDMELHGVTRLTEALGLL
ncbi:DNA repair protein RadA [Thiofaba sp. EF100]|uniref:DNA repair protein RadA n=1 Tax=Thiofaba sp. EF100 TaxID=3121274 RepID=UPI003221D9C9